MDKSGWSNSRPEEIDIFKNNFASTLLYRYFLASHYCKGKNVLDVGCGCGYGMGILKTLGAEEIIGMDIQKKDLEYARKKYPYKFIERDITKKMKADPLENQFDVVVSIETMEHIPRHLAGEVINNLRKWCRPGGTILIITPRRDTHFFNYDGGSHLYIYLYEELMALMQLNIDGLYSTMGIEEIVMGEKQQACSFLSKRINSSKSICIVVQEVKK